MKKLFIIITLLILSIFVLPVSTKAYDFVALDIINEYNIKVDPKSDGSLDIRYHINWTVLDDELEGPLTWVKIGVANKHVKNIKSLSDDVIDSIRYYDDDGSYIRIDFKETYYKNQTVDFSFSINQSRIFTLNGDKTIVEYKFIPGWFPDSKVTKITIDWKDNANLKFVTGEVIDGYYHTEDSLDFDGKVAVEFAYDRSVFPDLNPKKDYISYEDESFIVGLMVVIVIVVIVIAIVVIVKIAENESNDGYDCNSGFSGSYYWYYQYYMPMHRRMGYNKHGQSIAPSRPSVIEAKSMGGHSTGGSSCACACACACAGGGRAGCSRKDFYKNPDLEKIKEALDK